MKKLFIVLFILFIAGSLSAFSQENIQTTDIRTFETGIELDVE